MSLPLGGVVLQPLPRLWVFSPFCSIALNFAAEAQRGGDGMGSQFEGQERRLARTRCWFLTFFSHFFELKKKKPKNWKCRPVSINAKLCLSATMILIQKLCKFQAGVDGWASGFAISFSLSLFFDKQHEASENCFYNYAFGCRVSLLWQLKNFFYRNWMATSPYIYALLCKRPKPHIQILFICLDVLKGKVPSLFFFVFPPSFKRSESGCIFSTRKVPDEDN